MADKYIDATFIKAHLGGGYYDAVVALTSVSVGVMIESATALVQGAMRNSGYTPPATEDPADVEAAVKVAVLGAFREMFASIPEKAIALPANWATDPVKVTMDAILSGNLKLAAEPSQAGAVGGAIFTSATEGVDGARPPRASREQLEGY